MKRVLTVFFFLFLLVWGGCQSYEFSLKSTLPKKVEGRSTRAYWDAALLSLARGGSVYRRFVPHDRFGQARLLLELKPGYTFPTMPGVTHYANVGRIHSASATPAGLRQLIRFRGVLRAEAAPRIKLRRTLGTSSMLSHSSTIDPAGNPKTLTYKLTVPSAGKVIFKLFGEVVDNGGQSEAKWTPAMVLCPTAQCANPFSSDYASFGRNDPNDPQKTPLSHASLTHTFTKANTLFIRISSIDNNGGKFALLLSSQDIDFSVSQLTGGDIRASLPARRSGLGAGFLRKDKNLDGKGVLLGIVDTGIDWCHADFVRSGNKSQILFLWALGLVPQAGEKSPDPKVVNKSNYGVEYTRQQIEAALPTCDYTKVRAKDTDGHGTHVAGIAAAGGSNPGVAPGADLIVVAGTSDIVSSLKYLAHKAQLLKRPMAINMSLGYHTTSHDGSGLAEKVVDQLIAPGFVIVVSAGNEGQFPLHATAKVGLNQTTTLRFSVQPREVVNLNFFTDKSDEYLIKVSGLGKTLTLAWGKKDKPALKDVSVEWGAGQTALNPKLLKSFFVLIPDNDFTKEELFTFTITRTKGTGSGVFHVYDTTEKGEFLDHVPKNPDGSVQGTLVSPGNSRGSITVGSYGVRDFFDRVNKKYFDAPGLTIPGGLSGFSSRGPTRDGRSGVTLLAPGSIIESTMPGYVKECQKDATLPDCSNLLSSLTTNQTYLSSGTSMASPMVAGATALLLQKDPTAFVRPLFQTTAQSPAWVTTKPASMYGAGMLRLPDAYEKWSKGKTPKITLETVSGTIVGTAPFKVDLKVTVQNGVTISEFFWNLDGKRGNDLLGTKPTTSVTLSKVGELTVSVVAVGDTGRTATATLKLQAKLASEKTSEPKPSETTAQEKTKEIGKPDAGKEATPPELKKEATPPEVKKEATPPEPKPVEKKGSAEASPTEPERKAKGGCNCTATPELPSPIPMIGLGFLLLFFLKRRGLKS